MDRQTTVWDAIERMDRRHALDELDRGLKRLVTQILHVNHVRCRSAKQAAADTVVQLVLKLGIVKGLAFVDRYRQITGLDLAPHASASRHEYRIGD